ncbi:MAG TPA: rod shape-determining protein MreD [Candidatus Omnitrophota bacterium]|nr:rod shape-determining protein MreD [Candidatus Omnitrophota bacterium]
MPRLFSAKVILYFLFLIVLDGAILPVFHIASVFPSFLYLFVCYTAFEWGPQKTVYIAFWAGLARDLLGGGMIGVEATGLVALALGLDFLVQKMEREFPGMYWMITFLFVFFAGILRLFLGFPDELSSSVAGEYLGMITLAALYSSLVLPVFYFLTNRWFGQFTGKQYELFRS